MGLIIFILLTLVFPKPVKANFNAGNSGVLENAVLGIENVDMRINQLEEFLKLYRSPLAPYAGNFIEAADKYDIDWRLVAAIAGVESSFGKFIPFNSYNAYGWNNGNYQFNSWEESIEIVSKTLSQKYYARGLDNPYKIGPVYAPPSTTWAGKVTFFMEKITSFDSKSPDLTI